MSCTLVLLPGLDGTTVLFEPLLRELKVPSIAVEYPVDGPNTYAELLPKVLAALPQDRDYILVGWSFSGPLAVMAAATRPPGLRGLVLTASFVTKPVFLPRCVQHLARPFLFRNVARLASLKALLGGYRTSGLQELLQRAHGLVPPEVFATRVRETLRVDVRAELSQCEVPMLYLAASRDFVVPRVNVRRMQRLRPDLEVHEITGPHLAMATNPAAAASALSAFSERVGRAAASG